VAIAWIPGFSSSETKARGTVFGRKAVLDAGERRKIAERYAAGETMAALAREYSQLAARAREGSSNRCRRPSQGHGAGIGLPIGKGVARRHFGPNEQNFGPN
jgi:hypothetical protein